MYLTCKRYLPVTIKDMSFRTTMHYHSTHFLLIWTHSSQPMNIRKLKPLLGLSLARSGVAHFNVHVHFPAACKNLKLSTDAVEYLD